MKVLVLGSSGLLGQTLIKDLSTKDGIELITHANKQKADYNCDLRYFEETEQLVSACKPNFVINLVALTNVDQCQSDAQLSYDLNVLPVINISKALSKLNLQTKIIHISTDQVYDKNNSCESDLNIRNVYGLTKYQAERELPLDNSIVLRTNFFGGDLAKRLSFTGWIESMMKSKKVFWGYTNVYFAPLHIKTLSEMIVHTIFNFKSGTYNLGSHEGLSKFHFIKEYIRMLGGESLCESKEYSASAGVPRPNDMRMNISKFEKDFQVKLPLLKDEMRKEATFAKAKQ